MGQKRRFKRSGPMSAPLPIATAFATRYGAAKCQLPTSPLVARWPAGIVGYCPGRSATANVAVRQDADSVAEVREHSGAPWRIDGSLPRRAPCHVWRLKVIDRHVPMRASVSLRRTIAPRSQDARSPGKRVEVLLVVPRIEIVLCLGRDVHRIEKQRPGSLRRHRVTGRDLRALEPQQPFAHRGHAL